VNLSSKLFQDDSNYEKNQFLGFVSSHKKGNLLTSFHIHSLLAFHTDLQKNTIVTCILTEQNHILSNMQDWLLQIMQLIQYPHVSLFSTVITNEFVEEGFHLSQHSMDGYEAMGFDVTQATQDVEQSLFIYNKDQHANTCVRLWGCFPVGKIWSSHSTIKSRFDKP
jgi:hypothetical protein